MTTPTDRVRAALNLAIADTDSSVVRELLRKARRELDGKVLVPVEPTDEFLGECDIEQEGRDQWALMIAPYVEGEKE